MPIVIRLPPMIIRLLAPIASALGNQELAADLRFRSATLKALGEVMRSYRRGDYEAALKAAEGFLRDGKVTRAYCFYRGSMLENLGRLEEAEVWLRRHIDLCENEGEKRFLAIAFTKLGRVLLEAGRYDEARECFETSRIHFPGRSSGYQSMAEWYLRRGDAPAEAVRWAKLAMERERADRTSAELHRLNLGEILATLAWATAADTHSIREVTALVEQARASVGTSNVQSTALVQYQSGRAFAELGDTQRARERYREAARIDPQGKWGRAAKAAMG